MDKKIPSALLVNDIHISKDNISQFMLNWNEMLDVCDQYGIEDVIIGGDLWQSRSAQTLSTLMAVRQALLQAKDKDVVVTIAPGNHDKVDQEEILSYNHIFANYPLVEIIDDYLIIDLDPDVVLYVMSYFPENGSFTKRLQDVVASLDTNAKNILYCHEGIRGGLAQSSEDELPASIFEPFDSVLVGHYHNRKKISGTNIEYIGSSRQHNFGEDEEKGYTILYTDGSTKFIKNQVNTRYKVIEIDIADMTEEFTEELQRLKNDERYKVKVKITCKSKEASSIDKQKLIESGAAKVELVTEQTTVHLTESQDISKKFDKYGIKEEYTAFCSQRKIENVELGLAYLDKIN